MRQLSLHTQRANVESIARFARYFGQSPDAGIKRCYHRAMWVIVCLDVPQTKHMPEFMSDDCQEIHAFQRGAPVANLLGKLMLIGR